MEKADEATKSGILLSTGAQEKPFIAKVLAAGPEVKNIKADDRIVYNDSNAHHISLKGVDYLVIKEEDVLGTI
jgi:chaperonin GroES